MIVNVVEQSTVFKQPQIYLSCHGKSTIQNLTIELLIFLKLRHK
jgi:hypothetical protein